MEPVDRKRAARHRGEDDQGPLEEHLSSVISMAADAGARHRAALEVAECNVDAMAAFVDGGRSSFVTTHGALSHLVKAHAALSASAARAKTRAALCEARKSVTASAPQLDPDQSDRQATDRVSAVVALQDALRVPEAGRSAHIDHVITAIAADAARAIEDNCSRSLSRNEKLQKQCAELRQRLALAEGANAAQRTQLIHHNAEVLGLLTTIRRLAESNNELQDVHMENKRMKCHLRRLEAKLTPAQIAEAALPNDYVIPSSFRAFHGRVPSVLKKAAPALFALRLMDHRELSLTDVLRDWVEMADHVAELRENAATDAETAAKSAALVAELQSLVEDERTRRSIAEEKLAGLLRTRADATLMRRELDACWMRLSYALDEKVALAAELEKVRVQRDAIKSRCSELMAKLELISSENRRGRADGCVTAAAEDLIAARLEFTRRAQNILQELAATTTAAMSHNASMAREEANALTSRAEAAEDALRAAAETLASQTAHGMDISAKLADSEKRLVEVSKQNAELARQLSTTTAAAGQRYPPATQPPLAAAARDGRDVRATFVATQSTLTTIDQTLRELAAQVKDALLQKSSVPASMESAAGLEAAMLVCGKAVSRAASDAEAIRASVAERFIQYSRKIEALTSELQSAVQEADTLRRELAETRAWAERAAVPVTETVTGKIVESDDALCPTCEQRTAEAQRSTAMANEAIAAADALTLRVSELEGSLSAATAALAERDTALDAQHRRVQWLTGQLQDARADAETLHALQVELRRSVASVDEAQSILQPDNNAVGGDGVEESSLPPVRSEINELLRQVTQVLTDIQAAAGGIKGSVDVQPDTTRDAADLLSAGDSGGVAAVRRQNLVKTVRELWDTAMRCSEVAAASGVGSSALASTFSPTPSQPTDIHVLQDELNVKTQTIEHQAKLIDHYVQQLASASRLEKELAEKSKYIEQQNKLIDLLRKKAQQQQEKVASAVSEPAPP